MQQALTELMVDCCGDGLFSDSDADIAAAGDAEEGFPTPAAVVATYLDFRKMSIFAGTTEIQKNIISKALLA